MDMVSFDIVYGLEWIVVCIFSGLFWGLGGRVMLGAYFYVVFVGWR